MGENDDEPRYHRLEAWRCSDDLAVEAVKLARKLPRDTSAIAQQIIKCSTSAPANIAEGYGRASNKEFAQHLVVAHGSLFELDYWFHLLGRLDLLEEPTAQRLMKDCRRASRLVYGLMRSARDDVKSKDGQRRYLHEPQEVYEPGSRIDE